jgi:hypothetical protein
VRSFVILFAALVRHFASAGEPALMKMIFASIFTVILTIIMTLAAMFTLVRATRYVTSIESQVQRTAAVAAELFLGVILLLGTTWLATHLAVRIFRHEADVASIPGGPVA